MQVCNFVQVEPPRSAPQDWWCKAAALPAPARKQPKAALAKATSGKASTPKPSSTAVKSGQAQKQAATTLKPSAAAKLKAGKSGTPTAEPLPAEALQARCVTAPAALKQGSKRKHVNSNSKQTRRKADAATQPAQGPSASGSEVAVLANAEASPVAPEPSGHLEPSAAPANAAEAAAGGMLTSAAAGQASTVPVPALLTEQLAPVAIDAVPPNKWAKTAASKKASATDTGGVSAVTARALRDMMEDEPLLEALQELLDSVGAALPGKPSTANTSNAGVALYNCAPQPQQAAQTTAAASVPFGTSTQTADLGSGVAPPPVGNGNLSAGSNTANAMPDVAQAAPSSLNAEHGAAASLEDDMASQAPATAADPRAATATVAPVEAMPAASLQPAPLVATAAGSSASHLLSEEVAASAAPVVEKAAAQGGAGKQGSKRLRGRAAVLAKALGLSKSRAVKENLKRAQQGLSAEAKPGQAHRTLAACASVHTMH